jgi:hypothetical protein
MIVTPERVAHHESGHTVAALVLGLRVESVTIERGGTFIGQAVVHLGTPISTAVVYLAGPAASMRLNPDDLPNRMEVDYETADKAIDTYVGDSRGFPSLSAYAVRRAHITGKVRGAVAQLIEHHWPEIGALARALQEQKTIGGEAAADIYARSLRSRGVTPWSVRTITKEFS